jgi:hypothetical protein
MPGPIRDWPSHLGERVSVRWRLPEGGQHKESEAVGVLQSVDTDERGRVLLVILTRRGEVVSLAVDDVVAGKAF